MISSKIRPYIDYLQPPYLSWRIAKESCTYTAAGRGAVGTDTLFTVTGDVVIAAFWGICNTNLTEGGATATLTVGVAGNTAKLLANPTGGVTDLDDGDVWTDAGTEANIDILPSAGWFPINDGADIIQTIGVQTVTAGQIDFYCIWTPAEVGATVVAA